MSVAAPSPEPSFPTSAGAVTPQCTTYEQLHDLSHRLESPAVWCSAARLADVVMHRGIGASCAAVILVNSMDDRPVTASVLSCLADAFRCAPRDAVPDGVHLCVREERDLDLVAAVAMCASLSLDVVVDHGLPLHATLRLHHSLTHLRLTADPATLAALMQTARETCRFLSVLSISVRDAAPSPEQNARILASIACLPHLQCLQLGLAVMSESPEAMIPVLHLPRLIYLELRGMQIGRSGIQLVVEALARRVSPLRALLIQPQQVSEPYIAAHLFTTVAGVTVLRHLWWLNLGDLSMQPGCFGVFLSQVVPMLNELRHLSLTLHDVDREVVSSALAALPRPHLLTRLHVMPEPALVESLEMLAMHLPYLQDIALSCVTSAYQLSMLSRWRLLEDLDLTCVAEDPANNNVPQLLQHLPQLRRLLLPDTMTSTALVRVCRDALPAMTHLRLLALPNAPVLTWQLAEQLHQVLLLLQKLNMLELRIGEAQQPLLRCVFDDLRPYALLHVLLRCETHASCIVPIQLMRGAVSVQVVPDEFSRIALLPGKYYGQPCAPDPRDDVADPCGVPSLYVLAATVVLRQLPIDQDLGLLPSSLSRQALRAQLMHCDQCGVYRRYPESSFIAVRSKPHKVIEVLRCYTCHVSNPPAPLATVTRT